MEASNSDLLHFAIDSGMISLEEIQLKFKMKKEAEIIARHKDAVWKAKNGLICTHYTDAQGKRHFVKRRSMADMNTFLLGLYGPDACSPKMDVMYRLWIDEKLEHGDIKRQTYDKYDNIYRRFFINNPLAAEIRNAAFADIDESMLDRLLYPSITELKATRKFFSDVLTILRGVYRYARRHKYTTFSVSTYIADLDRATHLFEVNRKSKEELMFSYEEETMLRTYLTKQSDLRSLGVLLLFESGARVGEIVALKKSDVDGDVIKISRTEIKRKDPTTGKNVIAVEDATKTFAGTRQVVLKGEGEAIVRQILSLSNPNSEWLFAEADGHRICESGLRRKLYRACDAVNIPRRSPHKIRKTYATNLMYAGVNEDILKNQLGHTDIATTRRSYVIDGGASRDLVRRELQKASNQ